MRFRTLAHSPRGAHIGAASIGERMVWSRVRVARMGFAHATRSFHRAWTRHPLARRGARGEHAGLFRRGLAKGFGGGIGRAQRCGPCTIPVFEPRGGRSLLLAPASFWPALSTRLDNRARFPAPNAKADLQRFRDNSEVKRDYSRRGTPLFLRFWHPAPKKAPALSSKIQIKLLGGPRAVWVIPLKLRDLHPNIQCFSRLQV